MKKLSFTYPDLAPLWIAVFVDILGFSIILPFLPFFMLEYNVSPLIIGFLLSSNAIFGFVFGPLLGKLSDKFGRKPLLLISQAGTVVGFIILAISNSIEILFLARIIDGIFGGQFPISKAVIGDVVPPRERPKQMTNIGVTFTLAFLIGPAVGGMLSPYGIIAPGILASLLASFTLIFTLIFLKESLPMKTMDLESLNAKTIPIVTKTVEDKEKNFTSKQFKNHFETQSIPLWKNKKALLLLVQYSFLAIAAGIFQSSFSLFGAIRFGLDAQTIGFLLSAMGIFQVVFRSFAFNRIRTSLGDPKTAMLGLGSYILAYFLLGFVSNVWILMLVLFYISFCGATSRGITIGFTSRSVDFRNQGKIMGITTSIDNISQIVGPLIGGFLLSLTINTFYSVVMSILSILPFIISFQVLRFGFDNREKKKIELKKIVQEKIIPQ